MRYWTFIALFFALILVIALAIVLWRWRRRRKLQKQKLTAPPPPPKNLPPPPPSYVPPVDVQVSAPPPVNAIAAVSNTPQPPAPPSPLPVSTAPAAPVRVGAVVNSANCEKPEYPSASRRLEEEGTVSLRFLVGVDGKVIQAEVDKSSGYRRLDEAARAGLAKCQFKPATVDGKPEQAWASMKYTWRLE